MPILKLYYTLYSTLLKCINIEYLNFESNEFYLLVKVYA